MNRSSSRTDSTSQELLNQSKVIEAHNISAETKSLQWLRDISY